jgi:hypothetical protein
MSRTKSVRAILPALPSDITREEAERSFNRESACQLRAMAVNAEKLARHWEKIRSHRQSVPALLIPPTPEPALEPLFVRPPGIRNAWRDIVAYVSELTKRELEESPI